MYKSLEAISCLQGSEGQKIKLNIEVVEYIAKGSFGKVYKSRIFDDDESSESEEKTGEIVAIKKVFDNTGTNRELQILQKLNHPNILCLKYYFFKEEHGVSYLNMVVDYIPNNLRTMYLNYLYVSNVIPTNFVKVILYQLLRGLAYIHYNGICHRDIKPLNLLVEAPRHTLKIADFGSAKMLIPGETNLTYICSRYYRAPELAFGTKSYSSKIDIWSAGCVLAELLLGKPLFIADSSVDLICQISKVLGTPTSVDLKEMNEAFCKYEFPELTKTELKDVFPKSADPKMVSLLSKMLVYRPSLRIEPQEALFDEAFFELLETAVSFELKGNKNIPPFVNFSAEELGYCPKYSELKSYYDSRCAPAQNIEKTQDVLKND